MCPVARTQLSTKHIIGKKKTPRTPPGYGRSARRRRRAAWKQGRGPRPTGRKLGHGEGPGTTGAAYRDRRRRRMGGSNSSRPIPGDQPEGCGGRRPGYKGAEIDRSEIGSWGSRIRQDPKTATDGAELWAGVIVQRLLPDLLMGEKHQRRALQAICAAIMRKRPK